MVEQQPADTRIAPALKLNAEKRATRTLSPEEIEKLREAREAAVSERKATKKEIREHALNELWPKAFQVMNMALDGAIDKGVADRDAIGAAFRILEQKFGKPTQTQKIEADTVTKIEYVASPYNFINEN
jgi:hypothetical protein